MYKILEHLRMRLSHARSFNLLAPPVSLGSNRPCRRGERGWNFFLPARRYRGGHRRTAVRRIYEPLTRRNLPCAHSCPSRAKGKRYRLRCSLICDRQADLALFVAVLVSDYYIQVRRESSLRGYLPTLRAYSHRIYNNRALLSTELPRKRAIPFVAHDHAVNHAAPRCTYDTTREARVQRPYNRSKGTRRDVWRSSSVSTSPHLTFSLLLFFPVPAARNVPI